MDLTPDVATVLAQMGHAHMVTLNQKKTMYTQYKQVMQTARDQEKQITAQMAQSQTTVLPVLDHDNNPSFIALSTGKKRPPLGASVLLELFEQYTREKLLAGFQDLVPIMACKNFLREELLAAEQVQQVEELAPETRVLFLQRVALLHDQFSQHLHASLPHLVKRFVYDQIVAKLPTIPLTDDKKAVLATEVQRTSDRMLTFMSTAVVAYNLNAEAQQVRTKIQEYIKDYREDNSEDFHCIKVKKKLKTMK
jgi:hypothetical protein